MATVFKNNKFFPQNFYLNCNDNLELDIQAGTICTEAIQLSPESFNGEKPYFKFILRYCPPYEHEKFCDLRRLQEAARSNTRFKDEYRGYILIDIAEWKGHLTEELFADVTMSFLSDMSGYWKYIFVSSGCELSEDDLSVLQRFFRVKELDQISFSNPDLYKAFFDSIDNNYGIHLSSLTQNLFRRFIPQKAIRTKESVIAIENDLKAFFGSQTNVRAEMMANYLKNPDGLCFGFISEQDMKKILHINKEEITL